MDFLRLALGWLGERFRYLALWPINLIRDLPVRLKRLLQTLGHLLLGLIFLTPEIIDAARFGELRTWFRYKLGRIFSWLHRLLWQLFDLVGGPEIGQFVFGFFTMTSPLTPEEKAMMAAIIGPQGIRFNEVRVAQGGLLDIVFRMNGNLAFATWRTINIPRTGRHTRANKPLVAHELTHVYQFEQIGSRYIGEAVYMLVKTKRDCYDYGGVPGLVDAYLYRLRYDAFNREQQAMIVQDFVSLKTQGVDVTAYEPFITDLQTGII